MTVRLLPYQRLTLHSDNPPEVVSARLATMVLPQTFFQDMPADTFIGSIRGSHFKIMLVPPKAFPARRTPFPPVIVGDIVRAPNGTEILLRIRFQMLPLTLTLLCFGSLFLHPSSRSGSFPAIIGGLMLIGIVGVYKAFLAGAKRAEALLRGGLDCREVQAQSHLIR